jgi:type IX secretion system substrate protein
MFPVRPATVLCFPSPKTRCLLLLKVIVFFFLTSPAQTNISGVVNSYYKVVEVIPAKACVRLNTVVGLARLQKTLIIQMKGASVITTNNSTFGDTTSLNSAGNYELAIICAISGDSVFMFHNFLNSYTVADKVQLVKFAEYFSANVVDTVRATPWNNTNGTGGVIALSVSQTLTLNAPIYADGSGFAGGAYVLSNGTCFNAPFDASSYVYNGSFTAPQNGSYKGESVYDFPLSQSGGRGAPANGGGGGNNHNNGGAGGANLSAGGKGGGNSSSAGCTGDLHGGPGKPLKNWSGTKIFFGGGGGAGHSNGTLTISNGGGDGGGIIFIQAGTLVGNGKVISANGGSGGNALSDGASGGGGAGSIVMDVPTYSGLLNIQASGGKGGDENDAGTTQRCYGAGGGGSGGVIYFTGSIPAVTTSLTGGPAGLEYGGDPACNAAILPANGANGNTASNYPIRQSTDSASYCLSIAPLAVRLFYFRVTQQTSDNQLQWSISNPELAKQFVPEKMISNNWSPLSIVQANGLKQTYSYIDEHPGPGVNLYRLKVIEKNNSFFYSPIRQVNGKQTADAFTLYPNPTSQQLIVTGNFSTATEIRLFDLSGKLTWQTKKLRANGSVIIDVSFLPAGVYVLQIDDAIKKLVVDK